MKWLKGNKMRLVLIGSVAMLVFCNGNAEADFTFGEPTNLGPTVNWPSPSRDYGPSISLDGLSLYFTSSRSGGFGERDLWVTNRPTLSDPWGQPANLGPTINSSGWDTGPYISADGLSLFFASDPPGEPGGMDLWVTTRPSLSDPWGQSVNLGPTVNSPAYDGGPYISPDGLSLYFSSDRPGGQGNMDLWVTTRPTQSDPWGQPVNLGPTVNSPDYDSSPTISTNGQYLFFHSLRLSGSGGGDIWLSRRASTSDSWGDAVNLGPTVNSPAYDITPGISPDETMLFFGSDRPGGVGSLDLWHVPIIPIVDFNGDGIVDAADMCIIVDHWGENYSLCDIGPTPLGDGLIDIEDLVILSEHLFEEVDDPTLIAHWPLDEVLGLIAYNNAADCDGTLTGDPVWQPDAGMIDGALELDGINDYVVTDYVLDPTNGPFSVIAWIKGGASGQVVISQQSIANWLALDTEGNLMTEVKGTGRSAGYLFSETVITDGQWHRIGLVWDGLNRTLYVDGILVTEDIQHGLEGSKMGLYIGCDKDIEPGSFFSGLIDDIRIYNRAVNL